MGMALLTLGIAHTCYAISSLFHYLSKELQIVFLQKMFSDLNSYGVLDSLYKRVKQHFEIEFYICNVVLRRVRVALTEE